MFRQQDEEKMKKNVQIQSSIKISIVTWNLQGSLPSHKSLKILITNLIEQKSSSPDIIAIGTQECQRSLCMSFFCQNKQDWENMLRQSAINYGLVGFETLQGLHLAVLVKHDLVHCFTLQGTAVLRAGTCNILGNKGAVSIKINLLGKILQFITCHLAPHQNENQRRNEVLLNIVNNLADKDHRTQVFICGDLNYRIDITKEEYFTMLKGKGRLSQNEEGDQKVIGNTEENMKYYELLFKDQLKKQETLKNSFLVFYNEQSIKFPPTYKLSPHNQEYCHTRIPGWTDRIFNRNGKVKPVSYTCMYELCESDHRPVIATYELETQQGLSLFPDQYIQIKTGGGCQLI